MMPKELNFEPDSYRVCDAEIIGTGYRKKTPNKPKLANKTFTT
jgi:hypothetical protein